MKKYELGNKIIIRENIANELEIKNLHDIDILNFFKTNKIFQEQVFIANQDFYYHITNLIKGKNISENQMQQITVTLNAYLKRSLYRTTPFGTFSAIGRVDITNKNQKTLEDKKLNKYIKHIALNPTWTFDLVDIIEEKYYKLLKYKFNFNIFEKDNFFENYVLSNETFFQVRLDYNEILEEVRSYTFNEHKSFSDILIFLKNKYNVKETIILNYLKQLIENKFIISNIRPPLKNNCHIDYLLINLPNEIDIKEKLELLKKMFNEYEKTMLGGGIDLLKHIKQFMENIMFSNENYFQVNTELITSQLCDLSCYDFSDCIDTLLFLENIIKKYDNGYILFKDAFLDKFGDYEEVRVVDLFDKTIGIKNPYINNSYKYNLEYLKDQYIEELQDECFTALYSDSTLDLYCFYNKNKEIINNLETPSSFEIFIENISNNEIALGADYRSLDSNRSIGRFGFFKQDEQNIDDEYLSVEISYLPSNKAITNLLSGWSPYKYNITFNGNSFCPSYQLNINNIVIGINNNKFYFRDISLDKRIIFKFSNNISLKFLDDFYRFLIEISSGQDFIQRNPLQLIFNQVVTPKIVFKNIIIRNKQWKLSMKPTSFIEFISLLKKYVETYKVPNKISIVNIDMKLPIELSYEVDLRILYKEVKRNIFIILEENNLTNNSYCSYIVELNNKNKTNLFLTNKRLYKPELNKIFDKYIYFKILIEDMLKDIFWIEFLDNVKEKFFYINYYDDNETSIRIRIVNNTNEVMFKIDELLYNMRKKKLIINYSLYSYFPETNRYGGNLDEIEKIFIQDSIACLKIKENNNSNTDLLVNSIICASIYIFNSKINLKEVIFNLKKLINFTEITKIDKHFYNQYKNEIKSRCYFNKDIQQLFCIELIKNVFENSLENMDKLRILFSLIHLNFNRLIGINELEENRSRYILFNLINEYYYTETLKK